MTFIIDMSGHSKWAKIHRQKAVSDAKKGAVFTKLANAITLAAKQGGGDPEMNFKLKLAIEKARSANMPKDNIDRAIFRGGGAGSGSQIEQVIYEGFGPGGIAIVVECATDNRNRTSANIKHLFSEYGGSLGARGSVLWQFENKGMIGIENSSILTDELELELIDLGAQDIDKTQNGIVITCVPQNLEKIKNFLNGKFVKISFADTEMVSKNKMKIKNAGVKQKIEKFTEELENNEEVSDYFTNAEYEE